MRCFVVGVVVVMLLFTSNVAAAIVPFDMSVVWNGAPPAGAAPWLNATFDDGGSPDDVILTITATNLTGAEKVAALYFNLDPTLNPLALTFSEQTRKSGSFDFPNFTTGVNTEKSDGDGSFDILIEFETADGGEHNFSAGDAFECKVSLASLTANSFEFECLPKMEGDETYLTVAHVQGIEDIGEGTGGWVTIPEPATICLLGLGGFSLLRRRKSA